MLEKFIPKLESDAETGEKSWSSEALVFILNRKTPFLAPLGSITRLKQHEDQVFRTLEDLYLF